MFASRIAVDSVPRFRIAGALPRDVLVQPVEDRLQHLAVVLLDHHHVAVAADADVAEPQLFGTFTPACFRNAGSPGLPGDA